MDSGDSPSKGESADPSKSPTPGIQPLSSSFEAYVEEQYAITLALVGKKSMSSLTESQRAAVVELKAGITGPMKPSRIPRRIPHSNVRGKVSLQQQHNGHQMKPLQTANLHTTNRKLTYPGTASCMKVPKRRQQVRVVSPSSSSEIMEESESFSSEASEESEIMSPRGGCCKAQEQECVAKVTEADSLSADKRVIRELNPFRRRDVDNGLGNRKHAQSTTIKAQQRPVEQEGQRKEPFMRASRHPCMASQGFSTGGHCSVSDSEKHGFSVNTHSRPSHHLLPIQLNTQLKGPKWSDVDGYRQQYACKTHGRGRSIRALHSPQYKPQPKNQPVGYLQRFLRSNVLTTCNTDSHSTQSTPGTRFPHHRWLHPPRPPPLYWSAPAFGRQEPNGNKHALYSSINTHVNVQQVWPGAHQQFWRRSSKRYPHHLPPLHQPTAAVYGYAPMYYEPAIQWTCQHASPLLPYRTQSSSTELDYYSLP